MPSESPFFPAAACVQLQIALGDSSANIARLSHLLRQQEPASGSLLVLPELWASGFAEQGQEAHRAATVEALQAMTTLAARHGIFLAGSLVRWEPHARLPYNSLYLVGPDGVLGHADKQHLFSHWQEDRHYRPGRGGELMATPLGMVGALICYDLRFPALAREMAFAGCRLMIVSAQWPMARLAHWQSLVRARAIENQIFVVAGNACGTTGGLHLAGHSLIVAPDGSILAEGGEREELVCARLDARLPAEERRLFCPAGERPWRRPDADKICTLETLLPRLAAIRRQGSRIAFTNGCFDLLHAGHVAYLEEARSAADCLVVGLNSDSSVRLQHKGEGRPVNGGADRARVLAALGCVDFVLPFDAPTPLALISAIMPDVLVKGADWPEERIVGAAEVRAAGGTVLRIPLSPGRSTTALIARIKSEVAR